MMSPLVLKLSKFIELDLVSHLVISSIIRLVLLVYGVFHDAHFEVPYTDVDYKVFTDAARHVVNGASPYNRHTFRYSPLVAFLLTPNIYLNELFGKVVFCQVDLLVAYLIRKLVYLNIIDWMTKFESFTSKPAPLMCAPRVPKTKRGRKLTKYNAKVDSAQYWAQRSMLFWLYNPMTIAISTRGNSDSLACLLVILTLYAIQINWYPFVVGLLHGLCIHFRVYPIIYSLLYYMHYSSYAYYFQVENKPKKSKALKKAESKSKFRVLRYLLPNFDQLMLMLGTLASLLGFTGLFYLLYGYKFLYESLIYHVMRVDFKHNFSLYFYLQYLTAFIKFPVWYTASLWQPILINLPPIVLFINFSIRYGLCKFALNFGVLAQTVTFVIFNKVLTSQYFIWIMGLLPLCMWQIKLSSAAVYSMLAVWFLAQAAWLLPAYLLEFKGEDTFLHIWIQGVSLFCAHVAIFGKLIKHFILPFGELRSFND